jgi:hypothetical protein
MGLLYRQNQGERKRNSPAQPSKANASVAGLAVESVNPARRKVPEIAFVPIKAGQSDNAAMGLTIHLPRSGSLTPNLPG